MKIQSYIDVITNSSTTVFTFADNIEGVKKIINGVLKVAGSKYTCDDLFDITVEYDVDLDDAIDDYYLDKAKEHPELEETVKQYVEECNKKYKEMDLSLIQKLGSDIYNFLMNHKEEWDIMSLYEWAEDYNNTNWEFERKYNSYYNIVPKNPSNSSIATDIYSINNLFSYDASYC